MLVIPTIYTAVDRYTSPLQRMQRATRTFVNASESALRRFLPTLSDTTKQAIAMGKSFLIAGGLMATASFTGNELVKFEKNLASFRTIVSDLSDNQFKKYQQQIVLVGDKTKTSAVVVAESFEKIAGLNAKFAETANGLGQVSTAAITLSKASGDELGPSAENLVGIMNQFGFAADQANRTINVLAAGQAAGAASITQTAESLAVFGAVAKSSNTTIEQSVALIETLAAKSIKGSEAGTALRGVFVRLQKAGLGYKSGQFQINDALEAARAKVNRLRTAKEKDAFITKLFGMENLTAGKILMGNIPQIQAYTQAVTGTSEAQKAAAINTNTLSAKWEELKAKWVNMILGTDQASASFDSLKNGLAFVTNNLGTIISVGSKALIFFASWKALVIGARLALLAYNVQQGISIALQKGSILTLGTNTVALVAYNVATKAVTIATKVWAAGQLVLNAILTANPIGIIIVAIAALVAAIAWVVNNTEGWGKQWDATMAWIKAIFNATLLELKMGFQYINIVFWDMVNGVVAAWYWAQNKLGIISDEQYNKNIAQITAEKAARIAALNEYKKEYQNAMSTVAAGPGWHVKMKPDSNPAGNPKPAPAVMPTRIVQEQQLMHTLKAEKVPVEITIKDGTGGNAQVTKNPMKVPIIPKTFTKNR